MVVSTIGILIVMVVAVLTVGIRIRTSIMFRMSLMVKIVVVQTRFVCTVATVVPFWTVKGF